MKTKLSSPISFIKKSLQIYFQKKNLIYFLKLALLFLALSIASSVYAFVFASGVNSNMIRQPAFFLPLLVSLLPLAVFGVWLQIVKYEAVLRVVDGGTLSVKITLKEAWKKLWRFFLVSLAFGLILTGGFVLLVVPGIIFAVWFSFSLFVVVLHNTGIRESLVRSKQLVRGKFWPVFGRDIIFLLVFVLSQVVFNNIPFIGPLFIVFMEPFFLLPLYLLYKELA